METMINKYNVIIIGAGISGLAAASTLVTGGLTNILVLEAKDRVGGRIHSNNVDGYFIEYGAQWLHGDNNQLKILSQKYDLLSDEESFEGEGRFLKMNKYEYDKKMVENVESVVSEILKNCEDFFTNETDCDFSVGEYLVKKFYEHVDLYVPENKKIMWRELMVWHLRFQEIDNACENLTQLSAKFWGQYDFNGGDSQKHINYKEGYTSIIEKLQNLIPKNSVKLCSPVTKVIWDCKKPMQVMVDNVAYLCDQVIITIPLGVLKAEHKKIFYPQLPEQYQKSFEYLGFSGIGKIFLKFERSWWGMDKGLQLVWVDEDCDDLLRAKNMEWVKSISGFDELTVGPPNTLVGWVSSKGVATMENLKEEKVIEDCLTVLQMFTNETDIPPVKSMHRSSWMTDPFTRGCYSHITMDCDKHNVGPSTLSEPILDSNGNPIVFFAGEACHSKYFSTTHGAFDSGAKHAQSILDLLSKGCDN